jgi:hypothetical protein
MSLYVVITYDLKGVRDGNKYSSINKALASVDFKKVIVSKKTQAEKKLPHNTFVRQFEDDAEEKSAHIRQLAVKEIKRIFKENKVRGTYFVFVGKKWAWQRGTVS